MLDKIVSKFSLYDILSMVIPGVTILLFFSRLFNCVWKIKPDFYPNEVAAYFIILVLAYLIGFVNLLLTAKMWKFFRNNPLLLYDTLESTTRHEGYSPLSVLTDRNTRPKGCLSDMFSYYGFTYIVILSCFGYLSKILFACFSSPNGEQLILINTLIYIIICVISMYALNRAYDKKTYNLTIVSGYYDVYYFVAKHRYCDDIFIMEGQVAFMQNMILPLSLFVFWPDNIWATFGIQYEERCFCVKFLLLLLCIALCICVYLRIKKIHGLVWENYEYLKINERHSVDAI